MVGAGPAGLLLARRLAQTKATFEIYERQSDAGGIWDIDAPGSPLYESAHFISSRTLSGFPGFPMPDKYPDYPNHRQVLSYIHAFADEFDLRRHIRFGTSVKRVTPTADGSWELRFDDGVTRRCRYLICANGVTWIPNLVNWPGAIQRRGASRCHVPVGQGVRSQEGAGGGRRQLRSGHRLRRLRHR